MPLIGSFEETLCESRVASTKQPKQLSRNFAFQLLIVRNVGLAGGLSRLFLSTVCYFALLCFVVLNNVRKCVICDMFCFCTFRAPKPFDSHVVIIPPKVKMESIFVLRRQNRFYFRGSVCCLNFVFCLAIVWCAPNFSPPYSFLPHR